MTKEYYVEQMRHMFLTHGWRECYIPVVQKLRDEQVRHLSYTPFTDLAQVYGAQQTLNVLDVLLGLEQAVADLATEIRQDPAAASEQYEPSPAPTAG